MIESPKTLGIKEFLFLILVFLIATDLAILLNIPFLRQILGFLFLTLLPGLLLLQVLKLNKLGYTEKFVLVVGFSISFLMFFGLLINNLSLGLGYETPLATIPLLLSFNIAFIALAIVGYKLNKSQIFSLTNLNLSTTEKAFLIILVIFPALSIFGMHIMNVTNNNIVLMFMLFLIPTYVVFVCLFNQKFPNRLYPVVIFLISISLLLLLSLRSNHIIGIDTHVEYYLFQTTRDNLHWSILEHSRFDACLSISLLPTIYQSLLNINPEFLFKILYSSLYSISPLVIYILSKRYVGELYGFLASCFFMFQSQFLFTELHSRTNTAILFFALAMMTLFNDKIDPLKKRVLFIVFMASCIVTHYSTTYIFFFIMLGAFAGIEILPKKYSFKKTISLTIVVLFFSMIFFWYSQVTEAAFNDGVSYIKNSLTNLHMFFVLEAKTGGAQAMLGEGIMQKGIPHKIEFVFTWLTFAFVGIGIITLIRRYREMSFSELNFKKPDFLKEKFEVGYFVIVLACFGLMIAIVAFPYLGYDIRRSYAVAITILSVFFVIGGITLSKHFFFLQKKTCAKRKSINQNASQVRAYLIILLVLIPYFLCVTGVMYQIFGVPRAITLNSEGKQYDNMYVHDQESYGAKWLKVHGKDTTIVYTDFWGKYRLVSQAQVSFSSNLIDRRSLLEHRKINGYIYLRYYNVVNDKLVGRNESSRIFTSYNLTEYDDVFVGRNNIYNNGGSEVYR